MAQATATNFPNSNAAFVQDGTRTLTKEARYLLQNLWNRTGGGTGADIAAVSAVANAALANAQASLKIAANLEDLNNVAVARGHLGLGAGDSPTFNNLTVSEVTIAGKVVVSAQQAGWAGNTTTLDRGPLADYTGGPNLAPLDVQLQLVTKVLGSLLNTLRSFGTIGD